MDNYSGQHSMSLVMPTKMALDLGKIQDVHKIYQDVVSDEVTAYEASLSLMRVMVRRPTYASRLDLFLGWMQGFILCGTSFGGSILDMAVAGLLSFSVLILQRLTRRSDLSKSGTE